MLSLSFVLLVLSADPSFYLETHAKTPTANVLLESTVAHLVPSLPPTDSNFSKGPPLDAFHSDSCLCYGQVTGSLLKMSKATGVGG